MSQHLVFSKSYDSDTGTYFYECNGVSCFSNLDMSEDEVRATLEVLY